MAFNINIIIYTVQALAQTNTCICSLFIFCRWVMPLAQNIIIRGEPEQAPNTWERGSGFIYIICLWGDHFSEKRVKIWIRKVMVVMRIHTLRARMHTIWMTTRALRPLQRTQRHETGKVSTGPLWQGSDPQLISLVDLFSEHEDDCMEAYPLRAWLQVLELMMVMACWLKHNRWSTSLEV